MERGCSRSFGVKDALDLEDVLRKGKRVKNECRQEGQESGRREAERSVGVGGPPGSPFLSYHALGL